MNAPPMQKTKRPLLALAILLAPAVFALAAACGPPRGDQGIDFASEGGADGADDAALSDAHGPCQELPDPSGVCTALLGQGTLYTHLITCTAGTAPAYIECTPAGGARDGGADGGGDAGGPSTFCCTTGLI